MRRGEGWRRKSRRRRRRNMMRMTKGIRMRGDDVKIQRWSVCPQQNIKDVGLREVIRGNYRLN